MPKKTTKAARGEATRTRLIGAARRLFARRGYAGVGTNEIVRAAKTTRGGLYYHFKDKKDLLRAVHVQVEEELAAAIAEKLLGAAGDPLQMMAIAASAFLDACVDPKFARIALIDAPSVLGWEEWREVDEKYGLGLIAALIELGISEGVLPSQPVKPLAHLLLGAVGEAGLMVANAEDPRSTRAEVEPAMIGFLENLRGPG
jgi:AcrR family transcriptional regulator